MAIERTDAGDALTGARTRATYNAAERQFSVMLQERVQQLLEGKRNRLELLRRYPHQPDRLGVMATPAGLPRNELRLPVVESLLWETLNFVCPDRDGGPVAQRQEPNGMVLEWQTFSTKFPHIVVERIDRYTDGTDGPGETIWSLQRVQNQREQTQINRLLDAANLALDLLRGFR